MTCFVSDECAVLQWCRGHAWPAALEEDDQVPAAGGGVGAERQDVRAVVA